MTGPKAVTLRVRSSFLAVSFASSALFPSSSPPVASSLMVPTPWASLMVAPVAPERLTLKLSLPSNTPSLLMVTTMVLVVSPGRKLSVPALPVKSLAAPAVALPSAKA